MQEVQRFNKVLKSLVLLGDLILLNLLLWGFNLLLGTRFWCIHCGSILSLCAIYFVTCIQVLFSIVQWYVLNRS
jgi:putative colanic acid biosynthesis UDP-glucose lipid carrier transferase